MSGENREPVAVNIGSCTCPKRPHKAGDVVYLRPTPNLDMGLAAWQAIRQSGNLIGDTDSALLSVMVRYGVVAWNLVDEDGPIRVHTEIVAEKLAWTPGALSVALKARELYRDALLAPLVPNTSPPAPPTQEDDSTSPNPPTGHTTQKSSGRSSLSAQVPVGT